MRAQSVLLLLSAILIITSVSHAFGREIMVKNHGHKENDAISLEFNLAITGRKAREIVLLDYPGVGSNFNSWGGVPNSSPPPPPPLGPPPPPPTSPPRRRHV